jgi:hypothetical protein
LCVPTVTKASALATAASGTLRTVTTRVIELPQKRMRLSLRGVVSELYQFVSAYVVRRKIERNLRPEVEYPYDDEQGIGKSSCTDLLKSGVEPVSIVGNGNRTGSGCRSGCAVPELPSDNGRALCSTFVNNVSPPANIDRITLYHHPSIGPYSRRHLACRTQAQGKEANAT